LSLFVDTSAFYASVDSSDGSHSRAKAILAGGDQLVSTDHVLVECWRLIDHRGGRSAAERFWRGLREEQVPIEPVLRGDLDNAWRIGEQFPDQDFSIVDRTSFAVMERLGISRVASFDAHFAIYRFGPQRGRAFDVQR
jgi:predicted nucleic acid-binding protein